MIFDEQLPDWLAVGTEPPTSKKTDGWQPDDKPPAGYFNWLFNRIYKSILEIRTKLATVDSESVAGTSNTDVRSIKSVFLNTDTRSSVVTYTSGKLTKVEEKNGATVIKTTILTYNGTTGALETVVETAGGITVTTTLNYDGNGNLTSSTKAVS